VINALRAAAGAATLLAFTVAVQAADPVLRLSGAVNYRNYTPVANLLFDALEKPVVLDLTIPVDNEETEGHLTTFVLDGQFEITHLAGPDGSKILTETGFELVDDSYYTLKGGFKVMSGGVHSGIPWLLLEPTEVPAGAAFKDVAAEELEPAN
jgi:hypothetical protein